MDTDFDKNINYDAEEISNVPQKRSKKMEEFKPDIYENNKKAKDQTVIKYCYRNYIK